PGTSNLKSSACSSHNVGPENAEVLRLLDVAQPPHLPWNSWNPSSPSCVDFSTRPSQECRPGDKMPSLKHE
ncbi:Hypothetical predicted protein, partial [Marmota monax]